MNFILNRNNSHKAQSVFVVDVERSDNSTISKNLSQDFVKVGESLAQRYEDENVSIETSIY